MSDMPPVAKPAGNRPSGTRFWVRIVLFVSLALNIAMFSAGAAFMLRARSDHADRGAAPPAPILYYLALDRDDRRTLREAQRGLGQRDPSARETRRAAVVASLRADPFVPEDFDAVFAADLMADEGRATLLRQALSQQVRAMDPAARAAYAQRLADYSRHGSDHMRNRKPDRD
jgi:hypothetical protein